MTSWTLEDFTLLIVGNFLVMLKPQIRSDESQKETEAEDTSLKALSTPVLQHALN